MSARTAAQALGDATSALVAEHDTIDVLARLMRDCQEVVPADAVGLVVATAGGELELLASTSHQTAELEIFQVAQDDGPCVESFQTGALVTACGNEAMVRRWPTVGSAIAVAGFDMVHSQPLLWREHVLGAVNLFRRQPSALDEQGARLTRAFADIATLAVATAQEIDFEQIQAQVRRALQGRVLLERAKGVLAYAEKVDMAAAYDMIVRRAAEQGISLSAMATSIVADAERTR
jgi:transcriptional regulator with GAF, ATPase, and Fis domain